jgi:F420H(2)-dependent quinone reductase
VPSLTHYVLRVHEAVYKATGGLIGHRVLGGMPTLLLHTTGRRSGQPRVNALTYLADGDRWVVVASKGGSDTAPAWLHNLRAHPEVEVQIARRRHRATARVIRDDDPEYARLWAAANRINGGRYDAYQARTRRRIPLVILRPAGSPDRDAG